ncbi:MAG TPA: hypothetical protein VL918_13585 [Sphingobium sp.]|nr:hypothetical protein [Sphingobium sp.]
MEALWAVMTVIGPILLMAVMIWAILRNRQQRTQASQDRTERATRQLYEQLDREDKEGGR